MNREALQMNPQRNGATAPVSCYRSDWALVGAGPASRNETPWVSPPGIVTSLRHILRPASANA
jgi:hypothetical protein